MSKGKRLRAEREARRIAHVHTQCDEGQWLGEVGKVGENEPPVARVLIERYNAASANLLACPHLQQDPDQARFWVDAVPELLACKECTPVLAAKEKERANTRCLFCDEHVALKGVSVAVSGVLLRGGVCRECEPRGGLDALASA
jgi:hypothetical protein